MEPGSIVFVSDDAGVRRPVIVVSRESLNRGNYVLGVPMTTAQLELRSRFPHCVRFYAGDFGLLKDCVAQAEALTVYPKHSLDSVPIGVISPERFRDVIKAIGFVLDANCEPE